MTEQKKAQEINSVIQKIQQSVDTLSEVAMSSFDYDAFVKDKAYADTYTKSVQKSVLDFANHTNGAVTAYLRYNPKYSNPTSGVFAQRPSLDQNLECLTPTDFSMYDDLEQNVLGDYENFAKMGQQYHMDADTFRDIMQETKNAVEELEKHIGQIGSTVADINTMVEQSSDGISGIAEKSGSTQNLVEDGYEKLQECNRSVDVIKEFVAQFHLD